MKIPQNQDSRFHLSGARSSTLQEQLVSTRCARHEAQEAYKALCETPKGCFLPNATIALALKWLPAVMELAAEVAERKVKKEPKVYR